ncbi:hypothetical protein Bbelb_097350 [Branchiostoma belcheri]|nr:hypothetical protein Bbelb_097350 [Branchiostoma belcheri]
MAGVTEALATCVPQCGVSIASRSLVEASVLPRDGRTACLCGRTSLVLLLIIGLAVILTRVWNKWILASEPRRSKESCFSHRHRRDTSEPTVVWLLPGYSTPSTVEIPGSLRWSGCCQATYKNKVGPYTGVSAASYRAMWRDNWQLATPTAPTQLLTDGDTIYADTVVVANMLQISDRTNTWKICGDAAVISCHKTNNLKDVFFTESLKVSVMTALDMFHSHRRHICVRTHARGSQVRFDTTGIMGACDVRGHGVITLENGYPRSNRRSTCTNNPRSEAVCSDQVRCHVGGSQSREYRIQLNLISKQILGW